MTPLITQQNVWTWLAGTAGLWLILIVLADMGQGQLAAGVAVLILSSVFLLDVVPAIAGLKAQVNQPPS